MKLSEIKPNPNNPRICKDDKFKKLVQSLKDFPQMMALRPIIVDENNVIQGGNMRFKALSQLGYKDVPDEWVKQGKDLTEEQWREFVVKDNVGFGEFDWEILANEWDSDQLTEWGIDLPTDFSTPLDAEEDGFEVPIGGIETDIVLGDLFEIGEHRLLCGDSTQTDTFEKLMGGGMADLVITDPPYNVSYTGKTKDALKIKNDTQSDEKFYQFLYDFYTAQSTCVKDGGAWYVWHADSEGANFRSAMKKMHDAGFKTFASIEPIIDFESSYNMVVQTSGFCDLYKIGLMSGGKYDKMETDRFMFDIITLTTRENLRVYLKDSMFKYSSYLRENLPFEFVDRDYNMCNHNTKDK